MKKEPLYLEWTIIPLRPWVLKRADGTSLPRRFHTSEDAFRWLKRNGYEVPA